MASKIRKGQKGGYGRKIEFVEQLLDKNPKLTRPEAAKKLLQKFEMAPRYARTLLYDRMRKYEFAPVHSATSKPKAEAKRSTKPKITKKNVKKAESVGVELVGATA